MKSNPLHVGLALSLQLLKYDVRFNIPLIGWDKNSFIVAKFPDLREVPISIARADGCIIRFVKDGEIFGFKTEVLSFQFFPAPIMYFKYPDKFSKMELRRHKRFRVNIPARIMHLKRTTAEDASIVDISEAGCQVKLSSSEDHVLETSDLLYITFSLMGKNLELDCVLRNYRSVDNSKRLGIEFNSLSGEKAELVKSIIAMMQEAA